MPPEPKQPPRWSEYMRLDDIAERGDVRNPKGHDIAKMRESLGRFGYTEPVMLDERTGKLVSGHGRTELLLGEKALADAADEPPELPEGLMLDDDGMWLVPVNRGWSSKDDKEAGAYILAANQLTTAGGWNDDPLRALLAEVNTGEHGLSGTGFVEDDLMAMLAAAEPPAAKHVEFDANPEVREQYLVLVECKDEAHQRALLERFMGEGLDVKALTS